MKRESFVIFKPRYYDPPPGKNYTRGIRRCATSAAEPRRRGVSHFIPDIIIDDDVQKHHDTQLAEPAYAHPDKRRIGAVGFYDAEMRRVVKGGLYATTVL